MERMNRKHIENERVGDNVMEIRQREVVDALGVFASPKKQVALRLELSSWDDSDETFASAIGARDCFLSKIGFSSYGDYLQSSIWEWIKGMLLKDGRYGNCISCNSVSGLVWHHRTYAPKVLVGNFSSQDAGPVVRVCGECHSVIHSGYPSMGCTDRRLAELRMRLMNGESFRFASAACLQIGELQEWKV